MSLLRYHQRITAKTLDVSAAPVLTVAFGDSVTQGFTSANTIEPQVVYHQQLKEKLERVYPLCTFNMINAGVAGATAEESLARLERDVLRYQPDLVIIAFGLNDAVVLGEAGTLTFTAALQGMIDGVQTQTQADLILLTPNFMVTADNAHIHPDERHYLADLMAVQTSGAVSSYAEAIRELARANHLALADIYHLWTALAEQDQDTNRFLANGLNHPNAEAHSWTADTIFSIIEDSQS